MIDRGTNVGRGGQVLREAAALIDQMRFSAGRGDFAERDHVAVLVDPQVNDDGTVSALVTCRAFAHRAVDWGRLAVWVEPRPEGAIRLLAPRFDRLGQVMLPPVPPGVHALCAWNRSVTIRREAPPIRIIGGAAASAAGEAEAPRDVAGVVLRDALLIRSPDGALTATLRPVAAGVEVAVETHEPSLAGRTVAFAFAAEETGTVETSGMVTLEAVADVSDVWEGVWQGEVGVSGPFAFVFRLVAAGTQEPGE